MHRPGQRAYGRPLHARRLGSGINKVTTMQPPARIDQQIAELTDWRGRLFTQLRHLIHVADPEITEAWKWETAVFAHTGNVCAVGAFKDHLKLNFFQGAKLPDPHGLFNAGLDAKTTRAIDFYEGDTLHEESLQALIRAAVALNAAKK